jgi:hypothetical protein
VPLRWSRSFARRNRTVVAVIHQPRHTAFILFDDVMLLQVRI